MALRSKGQHEIRHRFKVPIALKFTAFIALVCVTLMGLQARTAIRAAREHVEIQVNESGIQLVTAISALVDQRWLEDSRLQAHSIEALRRLMTTPGAERIKDIILFNRRDEAVSLLNNIQVTEGRVIDYLPASKAGVTIKEFEASGLPVRGFSRSIIRKLNSISGSLGSGSDDEYIGRIDVFLSARHIRDSVDALTRSLVRVSLIACLAATAASYLLSRFLARPIRTLVRDMRQVSTGDFEHRSRVDSGDELGDLARTFNSMTSSLLAAQDAKLVQQSIEQELSVATGIQQALLPAKIPAISGLDIAVHYQPAKEVGGDYYDFIPIDGNHLGIAVADVSGKSIPGSLVMTMTRSLLRMAAVRQTSPSSTLRAVNASLTPDLSSGMFVTMLYLVVQTDSRHFRMVRAGHNPPLLYSHARKRLVRLEPRGVALGMESTGKLFRSELSESEFDIGEGDVFIAYTDGLVEGKDRKGADFGDKRLQQIAASHHHSGAREIVDVLVESLAAHERGTEPSDDVTILVIKG